MAKNIRIICVSLAAGISLGVVGTTIARNASFSDIVGGAFYADAVSDMVALGLFQGYEDGSFQPNKPITRGEMAVVLSRLADKVGLEIPETNSSSSRRSSAQSASSEQGDDDASSSSSSSAASFVSKGTNTHGLFRFTTASFKTDENDGTARVSIVRTGGKNGAVSVDYVLKAGTATEGTDYELQSGTIQFADGDTSKTFEVVILDDTAAEGNETVLLELSKPTGGSDFSEPKIATLTILDNEGGSVGGDSASSAAGNDPDQGAINFSALDYGVAESGTSVTIRVQRSKTKGSVSVGYKSTKGTASNNNDYDDVSGTLSFGDGESEKSFTVTVKNNGEISGNKTVNLALSSPSGGATLGAASMALLTIYDDETVTFGTGSLRFGKASYEVVESEGSAMIEIRRVGGAKGTVSVKYETNDGTAISASDYTETKGTMTFQEGEMEKTFVVPVKKDILSDGGESVNLRIFEPTGKAELVSPSTASLIIY